MDYRTKGTPKPEPYSVEEYVGLHGTAHLVGYDGDGDVMIEVRVPERLATPDLTNRVQLWMRAQDPQASTRLRILP